MKKPNIVWIIADDITPNAVGCYGLSLPTRAIDALASRGVRFANAWCASAVCTPSRFNYLTGCFGSRCEHPEFLRTLPPNGPASVEFNVLLDGKLPTLGSVLRGAGYRTGFAGKWHNSPGAEDLGCEPLDEGADPHSSAIDKALARRQEILCAEVARVGGYDEVGGVLWQNPTEEPLAALRAHHLEWSLDHSLQFLDRQTADRPFFLHYASTCYHGPNIIDTVENRDPLCTPGGRLKSLPASALPRSSWKTLCEEAGLPFNHESVSFLWLDREVRLILEALERGGHLANTIIVVSGDHGNEPGKGTCYDAGCRVPLIITGPGLPAGLSHPGAVLNVDLAPTLVRLAGVTVPAGAFQDGRTIDFLGGGRERLYFENGFTRGLRWQGWKYIAKHLPENRRTLPDRSDCATDHYGANWEFPALRIAAGTHAGYFAAEELYDLAADPLEGSNLAADPAHRVRLDAMRTALIEEQPLSPHCIDDKHRAGWGSEATKLGLVALHRYPLGEISWWPDAEERYRRHVVLNTAGRVLL